MQPCNIAAGRIKKLPDSAIGGPAVVIGRRVDRAFDDPGGVLDCRVRLQLDVGDAAEEHLHVRVPSGPVPHVGRGLDEEKVVFSVSIRASLPV